MNMVHNYNDDSSSLINILINIMNHHLPTGSLSKSPKAQPPEFTPNGAAEEIDLFQNGVCQGVEGLAEAILLGYILGEQASLSCLSELSKFHQISLSSLIKL